MRNPKARHEYFIIDEYVAGIVLEGSEVKSLRAGRANITESWCHIVDGEMWLRNCHISKNTDSSYMNHEELRMRKLLMKRSQIDKIHKKVKESGITIIPLEIVLVGGRFKMKLGIAKGKKTHDKRETLKQKDTERELERKF